MSNSRVCNHASFCVDCDCMFQHYPPSMKDRKIVKKMFDNLSGISKIEDKMDTRKANCRFGQLCYNEKCGFKHRLSDKDRQRLIKAFNDYKLNDIKVEKKVEVKTVGEFDISHKNSFDTLEDVQEEVVVKSASGKSWADICKK
jgi:hypothetical protein